MSDREKTVLQERDKGTKVNDICSLLHISKSTVETTEAKARWTIKKFFR